MDNYKYVDYQHAPLQMGTVQPISGKYFFKDFMCTYIFLNIWQKCYLCSQQGYIGLVIHLDFPRASGLKLSQNLLAEVFLSVLATICFYIWHYRKQTWMKSDLHVSYLTNFFGFCRFLEQVIFTTLKQKFEILLHDRNHSKHLSGMLHGCVFNFLRIFSAK